MANKKITGIPEIDMIAHSIAKKFGKENIMSLGPRYEKVKPISTGSISLDAVLGVGGLPSDRVIEIYGPPSAGKTSLCLQVANQYVSKFGYERPPVYIDLERTTGLDLVTSMGLDSNKMIFCYPDTAEEALQLCQDLGKTGKVGVIIFDSIDAAQSERDTKRLMNETGVGDLPRLLSKALRAISKISVDNDCMYLFINQVRINIGVMYGNPETTSGGNAIPFYSSVRLRVSSKPSKDLDGAIAMKVKIVKNKVAPALNKTAEFDFICGVGTDPYLDLIGYAKDTGLVRFAGSAVKWENPENKEQETLCTGGKNGLKDLLIQSPIHYNHLKNLCLSKESTYMEDIKNVQQPEPQPQEES
jgi:recombination protein RecA